MSRSTFFLDPSQDITGRVEEPHHSGGGQIGLTLNTGNTNQLVEVKVG
jgi:hypothetical protein